MAYLADAIQTKPNGLKRRLGAFSISMELLNDAPNAVLSMLEGCIVVRAEAVWHKNAIDYVAMRADFDEVPIAEEVPEYTWYMTIHKDGSVTRQLRKVNSALQAA